MPRATLSLLVAALAAGCRSPAPPLSREAVVVELPIVEQDELWECGLASITALCGYYGVELDPRLRASLAATAVERQGLSGAELRSALEQLGFSVYVFAGVLEGGPTGLFDNVDAGRPPLVMVSDDGSLHHYCLVLGYDPPQGHIVLLDPRRGRVVLPVETFGRDWERSRRFTLLAVPAGP